MLLVLNVKNDGFNSFNKYKKMILLFIIIFALRNPK